MNSCSSSAASSPIWPSGSMRAVGPIGRYGTEAIEGLREVRGREMARREWERETGREGAGGLEGGRELSMVLAATFDACS